MCDLVSMEMADESSLTIDEMASKLKCSRGWIQLSVDAGCPTQENGKLQVRDLMLFQLTNIHRIRELAGLQPMETEASQTDLRPNVKAILETQLEWLQVRSTRDSVKKAARLVHQKLQAIDDI